MQRQTHKVHFEDFSGQQFERLAFAYFLRQYTERGGTAEWYGQLGSDEGRDIICDAPRERTRIVQAANYQKLTFTKVKRDLKKLAAGKHSAGATFHLVCGGGVSSGLRGRIKTEARKVGFEEAIVWSDVEFEEHLRIDGPELLPRFVAGEAFPELPIDRATPDEPDVLLELSSERKVSRQRQSRDSLESVDVVVCNESSVATALDVRIDDLSSGPYQAGYWGGDKATRAGPVFVSTTIRFDPIPHLRPSQCIDATPINTMFTVQERILQSGGVTAGLWWLIDRAREHREHLESERLPPAERESQVARLRQTPIELSIRVTYSNVQRTKRWQRVETIHYDPRTLTALITHGDRIELTGGEPEVARPKAEIRIICDANRAEILVHNSGVIADFWATLRIRGAVRGPYGTDDLSCRWTHTPAAKARIAKTEQYRIVLAERRLAGPPGFGFSQWYIYAVANDHVVAIESMYSSNPLSQPPTEAEDIVLEGIVAADPDLQNGVQHFRVRLKAFEAVVA